MWVFLQNCVGRFYINSQMFHLLLVTGNCEQNLQGICDFAVWMIMKDQQILLTWAN